MVFLDTSALYAVLDRDDANHTRALSIWQRLLRSPAEVLTHNYVLVETFALAQSCLGLPAVRAIHEAVVPALTLHWVNDLEHRTAVEMLLAARRRRLSLVDCVSFVVMRDHGISRAFAFDRHFSEQGFTSLR